MFDVRPAPEAFARLAALAGAPVQPDPLAHLGPRPVWVDEVYRGASNGDLINGAKPLDVDLDELERAGGYISADQCLSYEDHRGNVLLPLAAAAVQQPDLADRLNALMHVISSQPGAFKGGYPRVENDLEWDKAIDRTERLMAQGAPVRGLGSFYHAAELGGFMRVPAPEPLELVTPPRVMEIAPAGVGGIECSRLSNLMSSGVAYKRPIELGGWLVLGELTVLNAPGGVGKTTLEVLMALALATGSSHLLDLMVYSARPVLFLNYEEVTQELVLKFRAAARHHRVEVDDLARIHLYGSDTVPATTMTVVDLETRQARVNAVWFAWLRQLVIETGAQVIFLDPYSRHERQRPDLLRRARAQVDSVGVWLRHRRLRPHQEVRDARR